ncbi:MAG: molybdopterin-dependent oxidoreductase [Dehalococcoidia bacterium]|nr:molybdopterin-dependent oxidoreductase [Dehalococcoidia bacterium]
MEVRGDNNVKILKTTCYICHGGCILLAHVKDGKLVKMEGDPDGPHNRGSICERALAAVQYVYSPYRLKYPLKRMGERGEGKWQRISWDEALDTVVDRVQYYKKNYGGHSLAYAWGTGRVYKELPFIEFFGALLGSPNGCGVGHICLSKTRAPTMAITVGQLDGIGGYGVSRDFEYSACIVGWGDTIIDSRNDYMGAGGTRIADALRRGAKIIAIDPVYTKLAQKAAIWLQIRPGTDIALALAWQNIIISEGLYDREFVEKWTNAPFLWRTDTKKLLRQSDITPQGNAKYFVAWDTLTRAPRVWNTAIVSYELPDVNPALNGEYDVKLADGKVVKCKTVWQLITDNVKEWTPEKTSKITWVPAQKLLESARLYATSKPASIEWGVSMSHCTRSTATNQAILQLQAITGNLDVRGGNPFWMVPNFRTPHTRRQAPLPPEVESKRITGGFPFSANPQLAQTPSAYQPGVWKAVLTGKPYPIKALYGVDSNPLVDHENPNKYILEALKKLEFIVWSDITMTPSNEYADIILPVCTPLERNWLSCMFEVGVFAGQAVIEPMYESKSDFYIFRELCIRAGQPEVWPWKTEEEWCDWQLEKMGITFKEFTKTCFFPAPEVWKKYEKGMFRKDEKPGFSTPSGKCELYASVLENFNVNPIPAFSMPLQSYETTPELAKEFPLILITGSRELNYPYLHSQYHYVPWLREIQRFPMMLINPETAGGLGIKDGNWAWVETWKGKSRFKSYVTERIHPKIVSVTHGWWYPELPAPEHGCWESASSVLVDPEAGADPVTGTTELRGLLCKVYRADGPPPGVDDSDQGGA